MAGLADKLNKQSSSLAGLGNGEPPAALGRMAARPGQILLIDPNTILPNPDQPRRLFDREKLEALAASVAEHGVEQPLKVRLVEGDVVLVAGERRMRAAVLAKVGLVPCIVSGASQAEAAREAIRENTHRVDLIPLDLAEALAKRRKKGASLAELAADAGLALSTTSELLKIAELPSAVKPLVRRDPGKFPARLLTKLAGLDRVEAVRIARRVLDGELSSPQAQEEIKRLRDPALPAQDKSKSGAVAKNESLDRSQAVAPDSPPKESSPNGTAPKPGKDSSSPASGAGPLPAETATAGTPAELQDSGSTGKAPTPPADLPEPVDTAQAAGELAIALKHALAELDVATMTAGTKSWLHHWLCDLEAVVGLALSALSDDLADEKGETEPISPKEAGE